MKKLRETPVVLSRGRDGGVRGYAAEVEGERIRLRRVPESELTQDGGGSTWDLNSGRCVAGPRAGARLDTVAVTPVFWFAWSSFYPNTEVID